MILTGICDCCDGADEMNEHNLLHISCDNKCDEMLLDLKRSKMTYYTMITSALTIKNDMIGNMNSKKTSHIPKEESKSIESQRYELYKLIMILKLRLKDEEKLESSLRYSLICQRSRQCAAGIEEKCGIFLEYSEYIQKLSSSTSSTSTFVYDFKNAKLSPTDTALSVTCPTGNTLIDPYTYERKNVADYLRNYKPKKVEKLSREQARRTALLVPYLEGREGTAPAQQWLCELLGCLLTPIIIPIQFSMEVLYHFLSYLWYGMELCVGDSLSNLDKNKDGVYVQISNLNYNLANDLSHNRTTVCPSQLVFISRIILNTQIPDTLEFRILSFFDYSSYSVLRSVEYFFKPYWLFLRWYMILIWKAPYTYYYYYFTNRYHSLPPKRESCQLREGLRIAEEIRNQFENELKLTELPSDTNNNNNNNNRNSIYSSVSRDPLPQSYTMKLLYRITNYFYSFINNNHQHHHRKGGSNIDNDHDGLDNNYVGVSIDYGSDSSWETLKNVCIEKKVLEYTYKLCMFRNVTQGNILLGKFLGWGGREYHGVDTGRNKKLQKLMMRNNKDLSKTYPSNSNSNTNGNSNNKGGFWGSFGWGSSSSTKSSRAGYDKQTYDDGLMCHGGQVSAMHG